MAFLLRKVIRPLDAELWRKRGDWLTQTRSGGACPLTHPPACPRGAWLASLFCKGLALLRTRIDRSVATWVQKSPTADTEGQKK